MFQKVTEPIFWKNFSVAQNGSFSPIFGPKILFDLFLEFVRMIFFEILHDARAI